MQVLGGFLAGAALTLSGAANAVTPVDVIDYRDVRSKGFDLIYGEQAQQAGISRAAGLPWEVIAEAGWAKVARAGVHNVAPNHGMPALLRRGS